MFLLVFGLKGAFFPLWFWLPDTYYTVPISIAGLFGGLLTKVGVYTVARLFPLIFSSNGDVETILADGTMIGGTSPTRVKAELDQWIGELSGAGFSPVGGFGDERG